MAAEAAVAGAEGLGHHRATCQSGPHNAEQVLAAKVSMFYLVAAKYEAKHSHGATVHTRTVAGRCWEAGSWGLVEGRPATGPQDVGLKFALQNRCISCQGLSRLLSSKYDCLVVHNSAVHQA